MKKIILTIVTILLVGSMLISQKSNAQGASAISFGAVFNKAAVLTWEKTNMDFGKIPQNVPVKMTFNFTNTGTAPLIIMTVTPSCGCTATDFTKSSIEPGQKGFVTLTYNASAVGVFSKTATVNANTIPGAIILEFNGEVLAAK